MSRITKDSNSDPNHSLKENSIENRKYSKDSFDRFGDDLCEDILSYFPLNDKFKYECVSKQWKRSVYQRVKYWTISFKTEPLEEYSSIFIPGFASFLRKFPNIREVYISPNTYFESHPELNTIILELIAKYCQNLKTINNLSIGWSHNSAKTFISTIEHKLEIICLNNSLKNFETLNGQRFPNLRKLFIYLPDLDNSLHFDGSDESSFSFIQLTDLIIICRTIEEQLLSTIIRSNKRLKYLCLGQTSLNEISTSEHLLNDLSELEELKTLMIVWLDFNLKSMTILKEFEIIGQKCEKLERLGLALRLPTLYSGQRCLTIIEYFPNLVTLELYSVENYDPSFVISCQSLFNCSNLRHLWLNLKEMDDSFFEDIHLYSPKLRLLSICNFRVNEIFIEYIEKLPELQKLVIENSNLSEQQFNLAIFYKLFISCARLKKVSLRCVKDLHTLYRNYFGGIAQFGSSQTWFIFDTLI